ncbi:hypothetical protein LX32DRAFT_163454 [Colletotrichum zoysiae]|uniref:Uncharacterized protein n=1 Tax=Colletotrichum zoysiae TaxID=1216348 RepID=A0AAD9H6K4_9PEZI|nr:hypothetical protein LX32DRAFT_163454 [Colletotrichum zoysiae]
MNVLRLRHLRLSLELCKSQSRSDWVCRWQKWLHHNSASHLKGGGWISTSSRMGEAHDTVVLHHGVMVAGQARCQGRRDTIRFDGGRIEGRSLVDRPARIRACLR